MPQGALTEDQTRMLRGMLAAAATLLDCGHADEAKRQAHAALVAVLRAAWRVASGRPNACPKYPQSIPKRLYGRKAIDRDARRNLAAALAGEKPTSEVIYYGRQLVGSLASDVTES